MKRITALLIALIMLASAAVSAGAVATEVTYGYLRGDVDDDTRIGTKDVLLLKKYLGGVATVREINELAADVNGDGNIGNPDLLSIKKLVMGIDEPTGNNTDKSYKVDTVTVAGMSISRYDIVLGKDYTECMEYSAKLLRNLIGGACGIYPNVTPTLGERHSIKFAFDTSDEYSLGKEGFRIDVDDLGDVTVLCGTLRGPVYAVDFLAEEFLGYRFLLENERYLYEAENVNLPKGYSETEVPVFSYRSVAQSGITTDNARFLRDNSCDGASRGSAEAGGGVGTIYIHAHSYAYQMYVTDPYGHPPVEKQMSEQPCLTSEETFEKIMAYNDMILTHRMSVGYVLGVHFTQVSVSPDENKNYCTCSVCKSIYALEGSVAGTVFRLSNRVAEVYETEYPGLEVYTMAYWDARNPPKMTMPRDNVVVCFCFSGCNNHTYDDTEACALAGGNIRLQNDDISGKTFNQNNGVNVECYEKWREITNNIYAWYYAPSFNYYLAPSPNLFNIYNDFKYIAGGGATGIYSEGSNTSYCFEYLRGYLIAKMAWDPFMSEEEYNDLMNEYLMIYYGDGWQYVREYIEKVEAASDELGCWTNNFDRPFNTNNEEYFRDNYDYLDGLFDKAYDAATTDTHRDRIVICRMQCDFLGLSATYDKDWVNGDSESRAAYKARYDRLYGIIMERDIKVARLDGDKGCQNFPKNGDVMNPMEWLWEDCTGYWVNNGGHWV